MPSYLDMIQWYNVIMVTRSVRVSETRLVSSVEFLPPKLPVDRQRVNRQESEAVSEELGEEGWEGCCGWREWWRERRVSDVNSLQQFTQGEKIHDVVMNDRYGKALMVDDGWWMICMEKH